MLGKKIRLEVGNYFGVGAPRPAQIIKKPLFSVRIYSSTLAFPRCGVVLSKQLDKRATARNRIKRAIMDAFADALPKLKPADYLFLPSPQLAGLTRREIMETITTITNSQFPISNSQ